MPPEFHFIRPEWLWGIPVIILATLWLAYRRLGAGNWQNVVSPALAPFVLLRSANQQDSYRWWLLGLGGILAVVAAAGPAWQRIEQPVFRSDQALVVALDLSRSMDAQDVAPSRLMRARLKILDILERRNGGETALIVYSSNAYTVTPLTTDTDTIAALVNSLSTDIMPSRGSYPVGAITKGRALLENAGALFGEILLITDGGSSPAVERAGKELRESGYTLSVLAVGTRDGAPIPQRNGGFVTDQSGNIAVPRLEISGLKKLAAAGGGQFSELTTDNRDIDLLLSGEVGARQASADSLATDRWREEGPWLLLLLLPLAALAFRRGWIVVLVIFVLPYSEPAQAGLWDDLWLTKDQQAQRLLEEGAALDAAETFENSDWRAVARYRGQDYAQSAAEFAGNFDTRSLYNLGNALARQGEFETAIDAYEQVLELDPDDADAEYNRDLLKELMAQQQQQQESDQEQESNEEGEGEQSDSDSESQEEGESQEGEGEQSESDESQRDDEMSEEDLEAMQEELERAAQEAQENQEEELEQLTAEELAALRAQQEQEQAMEQWLRRIPNDPGSLLRNKFRYQYQQTGKDQDGNSTWPDDEVQPW